MSVFFKRLLCDERLISFFFDFRSQFFSSVFVWMLMLVRDVFLSRIVFTSVSTLSLSLFLSLSFPLSLSLFTHTHTHTYLHVHKRSNERMNEAWVKTTSPIFQLFYFSHLLYLVILPDMLKHNLKTANLSRN